MSKTLLIAGCNGKVGRAVAELFKLNEWNVVGLDIVETNEPNVDKFILVDVKDAAAVTEAVNEIEAATTIDAVLNCAGYELTTDIEDTDTDEWAKLLDTVLGGSGNICKAVAPGMIKRKDGKIMLLSSDYSREKDAKVLNAVATNTLHGFGKSFGIEMAPENVLVNVLFANTPFDLDNIAETVFFLADKDTYTSAQVVSITGLMD